MKHEDEKNNEIGYGEINVSGDTFIVKEKEECSKKEWEIICRMCGLNPDCTDRIVIDGTIKYFGQKAETDTRYIVDGFLNTIFDVYTNRDYNRILKEIVYSITDIIDETDMCPSAKRPMETQLFLMNKVKENLGTILGRYENVEKFISMYYSLKDKEREGN